MQIKISNEAGRIVIDHEVVARVAGYAAMDCYGVVGMAAKNIRDGLVHLLRRESLTKGIMIKRGLDAQGGDVLALDLHIIVEYGTNISAIAQVLIDTVKYRVQEYVGIEVADINIFVDGIRNNNS